MLQACYSGTVLQLHMQWIFMWIWVSGVGFVRRMVQGWNPWLAISLCLVSLWTTLFRLYVATVWMKICANNYTSKECIRQFRMNSTLCKKKYLTIIYNHSSPFILQHISVEVDYSQTKGILICRSLHWQAAFKHFSRWLIGFAMVHDKEHPMYSIFSILKSWPVKAWVWFFADYILL